MTINGITTDVTKGYMLNMTAETRHDTILNERGRALMATIRKARPFPVRITGGSGWGKSVICRHIAHMTCVCPKNSASDENTRMCLVCQKQCSTHRCTTEKRACAGQPFTVIPGTPGLRVEDIVGEWAPTAKTAAEGSAPLAFKDGPLTRAVIEGHMCFFEELARAPVETQSRLFDVLDDTGRALNIPARDEPVAMNKGFWFISTENPAGTAGYFTQPMDVALMKRFFLHVEINEPVADEPKVLLGILGGDAAVTGAMMNWVTDLRRNPATIVSTRELVIFAKLIVRGLTPLEAAMGGVAPHYPEAASVVRTTTEAHFTAKN